MLDDRPKRERRKKRQRADDQDHAHEQPDEQRRGHRKRARRLRRDFFSARKPPSASIGTIIAKRPISVSGPTSCCSSRSARQPGERAAVVAGGRRERIEDL